MTSGSDKLPHLQLQYTLLDIGLLVLVTSTFCVLEPIRILAAAAAEAHSTRRWGTQTLWLQYILVYTFKINQCLPSVESTPHYTVLCTFRKYSISYCMHCCTACRYLHFMTSLKGLTFCWILLSSHVSFMIWQLYITIY